MIQNIDVLKERFKNLMVEQAPSYLLPCQGPIDDKAVEQAIDAFDDKEKRESFFKFFKELETLYEIISPDLFLREYLEDYRNLSILYQIVRNAFSKHTVLYSDPGKVAPLIDNALRRSPNHAYNATERRHLKAELYKIILPAAGKDRMVDLADQILKLPRKQDGK